MSQSYWIVSSNPTVYDSIEGFKNESEIDWGNCANNHIEIDDIVYIYITRPLQRIAIKTVVTKINYKKDELLEGNYQFNRDDEDTECNNFIRLKLVNFLDSELLSITHLQNNGINGNIQGKRRVEEDTLRYIQSIEKGDTSNFILFDKLEKELKKGLQLSKHSSSREIERRLENANKMPEQIQVLTTAFKRNPDVIYTVLRRANGICERCNQKAPFIRKSDNTPYLEVHHLKQLSKGGEDTVDNTIAVCPNCHRELHFGV